MSSYASSGQEAARLEAQAAALWTRELGVLRGLGLGDGGRLLDVGCGPAATLRRLVAATGARALGVDRDARLLAVARTQARVLRADAGALPLAAGGFDFVLLRFVLRHLRAPERALAEAARVCAPGGVVCVIDADDDAWAFDDAPASWPALAAALAQSARRRGGDPAIGRRLPRLLRQAGLVEVRGVVTPVSSDDLAAPALLETFLAPAARPVDADLLTPERAAAAWADLRAWAVSAHAFAWVVGVAASGRKPS